MHGKTSLENKLPSSQHLHMLLLCLADLSHLFSHVGQTYLGLEIQFTQHAVFNGFPEADNHRGGVANTHLNITYCTDTPHAHTQHKDQALLISVLLGPNPAHSRMYALCALPFFLCKTAASPTSGLPCQFLSPWPSSI